MTTEYQFVGVPLVGAAAVDFASYVADGGTQTWVEWWAMFGDGYVREEYAEASDCPICPMVATDRDDALAEVAALRAQLAEIAASSPVTEQLVEEVAPPAGGLLGMVAVGGVGPAPDTSPALTIAAWRAVAIALASDLADVGADPSSIAVRAYNHARNGRMTEALHLVGVARGGIVPAGTISIVGEGGGFGDVLAISPAPSPAGRGVPVQTVSADGAECESCGERSQNGTVYPTTGVFLCEDCQAGLL